MAVTTKAVLKAVDLKISPGDIKMLRDHLINVLDSVYGGYAEMHFNADGANLAPTTTAELIVGFDTASVVDTLAITVTLASDKMAAIVAGDYEYWFCIDATVQAAKTYTIEVMVDGVTTSIKSNIFTRLTATGETRISMVGHGLVALAAAEAVSLFVKSSEVGGATFTPLANSNFGIKKIG